MQIREINAKQTWEIRWPVLRPNGTQADCVFEGDDEADTQHFGAYFEQALIGTVSIYHRAHSALLGNGYQFRAMATLPEVRGSCAGTRLLMHAEATVFNEGADYLWGNSRASALAFYLKLGYQSKGDEFEITGIGLHTLIYKQCPTGHEDS